ncbi:hypothetical protein ACFLZN_02695, partial [Nanoarchaeota archaeon]
MNNKCVIPLGGYCVDNPAGCEEGVCNLDTGYCSDVILGGASHGRIVNARINQLFVSRNSPDDMVFYNMDDGDLIAKWGNEKRKGERGWWDYVAWPFAYGGHLVHKLVSKPKEPYCRKDAGVDVNTAGVAKKFKGGTLTVIKEVADECLDEKTIKESKCVGSEIETENIQCDEYCHK